MKRNNLFKKVYLGLGSNVGNRKRNLTEAVRLLKEDGGVRVKKESSFYETSPIGPKQRNFLNAVIETETFLKPMELLKLVKKVEQEMGRKKTVLWGPRKIDIDILSYPNHKICSKRLTLPHPQLHRRKFVLVPLCEIAPRLKIKEFRQTVSKLLNQLTDPRQKVRLFSR